MTLACNPDVDIVWLQELDELTVQLQQYEEAMSTLNDEVKALRADASKDHLV